jgi:purine nucleosidase
MKILLDTDIGGDLDDALALAYLLRQPACELLGITTVGGQAELRASLASAICQAEARPEVAIHVGASAPWLIKELQPVAEQSAALSANWTHQRFTRHNTAVGFLRETIRAHPGEITLLTIGPLSNIGLLFAIDPELPGLLKGLMMMGGSLLAETSAEEWNILCDPHAAAKVLAAELAITSVGVDVTRDCRMTPEACRSQLQRLGGAFAFVDAMAEVFFQTNDAIVFHDPLAAALLFEQSLCQTRPAHLAVDLLNLQSFGRTYSVASSETPHQVAYDSQPEAFFEHYFRIAALSAE